jgi:hypothetical protein
MVMPPKFAIGLVIVRLLARLPAARMRSRFTI